MRGGYQAPSRLAGALDEIRMEAIVARAASRRTERDRAFAEIERLAGQAAALLARSMAQQQPAAGAPPHG